MENQKVGYTTEAIKKKVKETLPLKLKEYRKKAGLTTYEVGAMLDKNQSTIALWETGRTIPDVPTLLTLCDIYKIADSSFFLEQEPPKNSREISKSERELIKLWRQSPDTVKAAIKTLLKNINKEED